MQKHSKRRVLIVGGGLAGGCCARILLEKGMDVTVIEKDRLGGLLNSMHFGEFRCDIGPHFIYHEPTNRYIYNFINRLVDTYPVRTKCKTFPNGLLRDPHDYPVSLRNIEKWDDKDAIYDEIATSATPREDCDSLSDYIKSLVGKTLYERYFRHYSEKFWGISPELIGTEWAPHRIRFPGKQERFFKGKSEYYPVGGYGNFIKALFVGTKVVHGEAIKLVSGNNKIKSVRLSNGDEISGNIVISTIDPSVYLDDSEPKLKYRSLVIIAVASRFQGRKYFFGKGINWGYFPNTYRFTRVTDYTSFDVSQKHRDVRILTFEFPCFVGSEVWNADKEYFFEQIAQFIKKNELSFNRIAASVVRVEKAYPMPLESEREKYIKIKGRFNQYQNFYITGRCGHYKFIWMKDIIEDAFRICKEITGYD